MKADTIIFVGVAVGVAALVAHSLKLIQQNAPLVNPASDKNLAYQGANSLLHAAVPGSQQQTIGTATYDALNQIRTWFGMGDINPSAPTPWPSTQVTTNPADSTINRASVAGMAPQTNMGGAIPW